MGRRKELTKHEDGETEVEECGELLEGQSVLASLEDVQAERRGEEDEVEASADDVHGARNPDGLLGAGGVLGKRDRVSGVIKIVFKQINWQFR